MTVERQQIGRVLVLKLNRPERGNRISADMAQLLSRAIDDARDDGGIGAIVITGEGQSFCLGGDAPQGSDAMTAVTEFSAAFGAMLRSIERAGNPVIVAVNGDALAGGFALMAAADLVVSSDAARFGLPEIEAGLFPILALATTAHALPERVFMEMIFEARILTAAEAIGLWLVNELAAPDDVLQRAVERAEAIAARSPSAVRIGRDTYRAIRQLSLDAALDYARPALAQLIATKKEREK